MGPTDVWTFYGGPCDFRVAQGAIRPQITGDEAFRIARLDAEKVYHDLSPFYIHVELNDDVWHIDYELKNKQSHGGGPHYVIDADTGVIRTKRYELLDDPTPIQELL